MKKTYFNRYVDIFWLPQCNDFGSTAGAVDSAVNMLEEALVPSNQVSAVSQEPDNSICSKGSVSVH